MLQSVITKGGRPLGSLVQLFSPRGCTYSGRDLHTRKEARSAQRAIITARRSTRRECTQDVVSGLLLPLLRQISRLGSPKLLACASNAARAA